MANISASVGREGVNLAEDVKLIQHLLNQNFKPTPALVEDGKIGRNTLRAIEAFQANVVHMVRPDGRIDPGGKSFRLLVGNAVSDQSPVIADNLQLPAVNPNRGSIDEADYQRAAMALSCEEACIKAVTAVEAGKSGYFPSGRPKILFEAHYFGRLTNHSFDLSHPKISSPKWNRALYLGGEQEYERLLEAMGLNRAAALRSASWGRFQIMGDHFQACGFASVDDYVEAMFESEGRQLDAFISFVKASENTLAVPLREKRWADFAKAYNGPSYAENHYDTKLQDAYDANA